MFALIHRLIAAILFVLVANPVCCCGLETAPKCCLPADTENDSEPETPKEPGNGGCEGCQCGEEMSKPTEGTRLAPPNEVGFNSLGDYGYQKTCGLPLHSRPDWRETLASPSEQQGTPVPIYHWHCALLI